MTLSVKKGYVKHVDTSQAIPKTAHWAILTWESVSVSDGYDGTSTEIVTRYHVFTDKALWEATLLALYEARLVAGQYPHGEFLGLAIAGAADAQVTVKVKTP